MSLSSNYYYPRVYNVHIERKDPNLVISATRRYCPYYVKDDIELVTNSCSIRYRYRSLPDGTYSAWTTILGGSYLSTNSVTTTQLLSLNKDESYEVVVGVLDSAGNENNTSIILTSENVFLDMDGEANSLGIGEAVSEENTVTVGAAMTVKVKGKMHANSINCAGTVTIGTATDVENHAAATMDNRNLNLGGDTANSFSAYTAEDETEKTGTYMRQEKAGSIADECIPGEEEGLPGEVRTVYANRYGEELTVGWVDGRAVITGLTEPVDDADAVNKGYLDSRTAKDFGAAPSGYGSGEDPYVLESFSDLDTTTVSGKYFVMEIIDIDGFTVHYANVEVSGPKTGGTIQRMNPWQTDYWLQRIIARDGTVGEWEWENPPMIAGSEYLTTEKNNGNAVTKKLDSTTGLPICKTSGDWQTYAQMMGAFPGFQRILTADDDMDTLTEDGVYVYSTSSVPSNAPFANAAVVMVFGNDSTTTQKVQIGIRYGEGGHFKFRALYASSWHAWAEILNSVNGPYELLWENASKTSTFAEQTIDCDTTAYSHLLVVCGYNKSQATGQTTIPVWLRDKGYGDTTTTLTVDYITSSGVVTRPFRKMAVRSGRAQITFGGGCKYDGTASDDNVIPYYIYGVKGVMNP